MVKFAMKVNGNSHCLIKVAMFPLVFVRVIFTGQVGGQSTWKGRAGATCFVGLPSFLRLSWTVWSLPARPLGPTKAVATQFLFLAHFLVLFLVNQLPFTILLISMASANCCISRETPSPDGEAPRLVESSSKQSKKLTKDPILCSSTVSRFSKPEDAAALQAIFENKSDVHHGDTQITAKKSSSTLSVVKSKLQKHLTRESVLICEEDKTDESDVDSETHITTKKSSSTLDVVKYKLKKHISRDSALSKHRSPIGSSEEEVERRAELRRLRHKRIQEELGDEEAYDDDAKSITTDAETRCISTPLLPSLENNTLMTFEGHDIFPDYEK